MTANGKSGERNFTLVKVAVLLALLLILVIVVVQQRRADETADLAAPLLNAPQVAAGGSTGLSGVAEPGSTVELWAGGTRLGTVPVDPDGTWSYEAELAPGEHEIVARTLDSAGEVAAESETLTVSVPAGSSETVTGTFLPIIKLPEFPPEGGVRLEGSGDPGATVELWAGTVQVGSVTVGPDGAWLYEGELPPGEYEIVARTIDASGQVVNESEAVAVQVPAGTAEAGEAAEIAGPELAPPEARPEGGLDLSGTAGAGATVEVWDGDVKLGQVTAGDDGAWSFDGELPPGDHLIVARTVDTSGQVVGESGAVAVTLSDGLLVAVPQADETQGSDEGTVILSGRGDPGATMEITEDGVVVGTATVGEDGGWTFSYAAAPGEHELAARDPAQPEAAAAGVTVAVATAAVTASPTGAAASVEPGAAGAELATGGQAYVVRHGDWLKKIARNFYNDSKRWRDIMEATNAKAAEDASYHAIRNPNLIRPGWKIWLPAE